MRGGGKGNRKGKDQGAGITPAPGPLLGAWVPGVVNDCIVPALVDRFLKQGGIAKVKKQKDPEELDVRIRARDLIGRTITAVDFRPFDPNMEDGPRTHRFRATDPVITLDNGRRLSFVVQETDVGEYGVELCLSRKVPKP